MVSVDINDTFELVLIQHEEKPKDKPTLIFRFISYSDFKKIDKLFTESNNSKTSEEADNKTHEAIKIALVGWQNYPISFDPSKLDEILSLADLIEIKDRLLEEATLKEMDKKKSLRALQFKKVESAKETKVIQNVETAPKTTP